QGPGEKQALPPLVLSSAEGTRNKSFCFFASLPPPPRLLSSPTQRAEPWSIKLAGTSRLSIVGIDDMHRFARLQRYRGRNSEPPASSCEKISSIASIAPLGLRLLH